MAVREFLGPDVL